MRALAMKPAENENAVWVTLVNEGELSSGEMRPFEIGELRVALYNVDGQFFATDNICTHALAFMSDGWLDDYNVECPLHGALFDIRDGSVVTGPAECALKTYPTALEDGVIKVLVDGGVPNGI